MSSGTQQDAGNVTVPLLREELKLLPAGNDEYGAPCWTIHDPVRNRYFRIGYLQFAMLCRWHFRRGDLILDQVRQETVLTPSTTSLKALIKFLHGNGLIQRDNAEVVAEFSRISKAGKQSFWKWIVHNYLFFRVPLIHPDRFLHATQHIADFFASRGIGVAILLVGLVGIFLTLRQWDVFIATFMGFANWQGVVWMAITLGLTKVLHEFGHAYSASRYGCRVPSMGVAFLVMYPVLYTDTSDAWRLTSKSQRLRIGAAGIRVELAIALLATFFWHVLPPGPLQSAVFLMASTSWIATLLINLSPFMRFDGYYLLSDFLGIANLQSRSFAIAKWTIREQLFAFRYPPPEPMPAQKRKMLAAFAIAVWIYRFFLFLGIALIVYHLFFKLLGIILFAIEIAWFIVIPVIKEVQVWWKERQKAQFTRYQLGLGVLVAAMILLSVVPWQSQVTGQAILQAKHEAEVVSALAGKVVAINVKKFDHVEAGAQIARMRSPELEAEYQIRELELDEARVLLSRAEANPEERDAYGARLQEMRRLSARIDALRAHQELLTLTAPISGTVREISDQLRIGHWVGEKVSFVRIVSDKNTNWKITAYVSQRDITRISEGASARFYPEQISQAAIDVQIETVERINSSYIDERIMTSTNGGAIAATKNEAGKYVALDPVFKVTGRVLGGSDITGLAGDFSHVQRGVLKIDSAAVSWARQFYEFVAANLIREMNF